MPGSNIEQYLEHLRITHSENTIKTFKSILRQWTKQYTPTQTLLENYDQFIIQKKRKNSTGYSHLCATVIRGYLQYNGENITQFQVPRNTNPRREALTSEHLQTILEYTRGGYMYYVITLLVNTGLRINELCNLRWDDIDFTSRKLVVLNGKGNKWRQVPLNRDAVQVLHELDHSSREYVVTRWDGRKITPRAVQHRFRKISTTTGIKVTPHMLRHTFATMMINKGLDVTILQRILGHETLNTTMQYIHHNFQTMQEKFDEIQ